MSPAELSGSIARRSFADAAEHLGAHAREQDAADPHRRPMIDLAMMPATASTFVVGTGRGSDVRSPPPSAGSGPLLAAAAAIAGGTTSAVALAEQALAAIDHHNEKLVGMVAVDRDRVRADAAALDAEVAAGEGSRSRLHGIPISVKDVIDVAGLPTRCGSDAYDVVADRDAEAIRRLRVAGAVIIGKAATHEFALGVTSPQSGNPHDPTRIPGGSSGGSAVSVATGMALASIGTDTRASIRVPAALSGVVGLKPTYGLVPTGGVVSLSWTMDHVAPMASTVADAAAVLDVLVGIGAGPGDDRTAGPSYLDTVGAPVAGLRIGVPAAAFDDAGPGVAEAVHAAIERLAEAGALVGESPRPSRDDLALANAAGLLVSRCEAASFHRSLGLDRSLYWEEVADQLELAAKVPAVDYLEAQRARAVLSAGLTRMFDSFDLLAMPTSPVVAPPRDDFASYLMLLARNAIPWSFIGVPAISVPCGAVDGLPVGLQLVAPARREDLLIAAASAWHP